MFLETRKKYYPIWGLFFRIKENCWRKKRNIMVLRLLEKSYCFWGRCWDSGGGRSEHIGLQAMGRKTS